MIAYVTLVISLENVYFIFSCIKTKTKITQPQPDTHTYTRPRKKKQQPATTRRIIFNFIVVSLTLMNYLKNCMNS